MRFTKYLKDKTVNILAIVFIIVTIQILLIPYSIHPLILSYISIIPFGVIISIYYLDFVKRKKYFEDISNKLENLETKYLIPELITKPSFWEGQFLYSVIYDIGKSMTENVNKFKHMQEEYKEYIELWIHEIKLPIATSKLVIENNKTKTTKSIYEELEKIENFVEQALYYARSQAPEKDYIIKKQNLKNIVNSVILKNKENILQKNVKICIHDISQTVYTDSKWCLYILNQILQNSIKYMKKENGSENIEVENILEIYSTNMKDNVVLYIKDNGVGISENEVNKVFDKGFTGSNGRLLNTKSTGIGLYLCKKLCNKLGLGIDLTSIENEGTTVKITFPKSSYITDFFR